MRRMAGVRLPGMAERTSGWIPHNSDQEYPCSMQRNKMWGRLKTCGPIVNRPSGAVGWLRPCCSVRRPTPPAAGYQSAFAQYESCPRTLDISDTEIFLNHSPDSVPTDPSPYRSGRIHPGSKPPFATKPPFPSALRCAKCQEKTPFCTFKTPSCSTFAGEKTANVTPS